MDETLTPQQAYQAMFSFMNDLHHRFGIDQLGGVLGGMSLLEDGSTADPAMWNDWMRSVEKARQCLVDATIRITPK